MDATLSFAVAAAAANGLLAGASLDQSIKQLPSRRRMGAVAYAHYARAADLGNGIAWYALLGGGAALLAVGAGVCAYAQSSPAPRATLLYLSAGLAILHSITTTQAAPLMHRQKKLGDDEAALSSLFDRFARWQLLRVVLQVLNFAVALGSILA